MHELLPRPVCECELPSFAHSKDMKAGQRHKNRGDLGDWRHLMSSAMSTLDIAYTTSYSSFINKNSIAYTAPASHHAKK